MTKTEWGEAVEWLAIRYPWDGWTSPQRIDAYWQDIKTYHPEDIWTAIHMYHEKGNTRAPLPSQLIHLAQDARRVRHTTRPALPPDTDTITWNEYAQATYGKPISLTQAAMLEAGIITLDDDTPW